MGSCSKNQLNILIDLRNPVIGLTKQCYIDIIMVHTANH